MRMRKKKHGEERLLACSEYLINTPEDLPPFPVCLEIGCGKGTFIVETAKKNPDKNYVAVEKMSDVMLLAVERAKKEELKNVKFLRCDAKDLPSFFPANSVELLYLNFSDPWPKKGYYKRRLTYRGFLDEYKGFLVENGQIHFKTDNITLFDFSLEEFIASGFDLSEVTNDLHNSEWEKDNVHTEYEDNFSAKGFKINRLVATKK